MVVQEPAYSGRRGFRSSLTLCIAGQSESGERHIHHHEDHKNPGEGDADLFGNPLDPSGKNRIEELQPDDCGDSPEKAVQKVDAAAQIEGNRAVIPEHRSKDQLCSNAAHVLVCTAQNRAGDENKMVAAILILI